MAKTSKKKYADPEKVSEFILNFNSGPLEIHRDPNAPPLPSSLPKKRYPANMKKPSGKTPKKK